MDDQHFDQLSKSLATTVSRRQAMKVLGATAASGVAALFGARGASAHHHANCRGFNDNCRSNAECCSGACINFHCACVSGQFFCPGTDQCVACPPPRFFDPTDCSCTCEPAGCPPGQVQDPNTCECGCPPGMSVCGPTCCPDEFFCTNGQCVPGFQCGPDPNEQCNPLTGEHCCQFVGGFECCSANQFCSFFTGCSQ